MMNLIFNLLILVSFQNISYAMEKAQEKDLSKKVQKIEAFLNSFVIEFDKKNEIIEYFKENDSIPIFIKNPLYSSIPNNRQISLKKILSWLEIALFGYSLKEWKKEWNYEKARRNNCYFFGKKEYSGYKIDKIGTKIASSLRNKVNLNSEIDIPILTKDCYEGIFDGTLNSRAIKKLTNNKLFLHITVNSSLHKRFPDAIPFFALAHEYAHLEKGTWSPYRNLLLMKAFLGTVGLLTSYVLFKDSNTSWTSSFLCGTISLGNVILGNCFKNYFNQIEEKACDLQAIEIVGSDKGLVENFSLKCTVLDRFSGNNWAIKEMKIEEVKEPEEYTTWGQKLFSIHPSDAQRVRYCKKYAEQLKNAAFDKNSYTYLCGYKVRKNKQPNITSDCNIYLVTK